MFSFFPGQIPYTSVLELQGKCSVAGVLILTLATIGIPVTGALPSKLSQIFFLTFTQTFCFTVKIIFIILEGKQPSIRHIQELLPIVGLHCCFAGLMFREISIRLIHYPCNKMRSWLVVNQGLSWDSVSDRSVKNMGLKGLSN